MDTRTGEIVSVEQVRSLSKEMQKYYKEVDEKNLTKRALKRMKVGRNEPCPCGSGNKFKKCCLNSVAE